MLKDAIGILCVAPACGFSGKAKLLPRLLLKSLFGLTF